MHTHAPAPPSRHPTLTFGFSTRLTMTPEKMRPKASASDHRSFSLSTAGGREGEGVEKKQRLAGFRGLH